MKKVCPLFLVVVMFVICSCSNNGKQTTSKISEGIIEYDITYPKMDKDDIFIMGMMPKEMKMKFKNNNTIGELKTGSGVFTTKFITDNNKRSLFHYLKLVNKKYGVELDSVEIQKNFSKNFSDMKLVFSNETKVIAGYNCKRADAIFDNPDRNFSIYYTEEIAISEPNWCTPFHEIKGVLMEYTIIQFNFEMRLVARQILQEDLSDDEFAIPAEYEKITAAEMEEKFTDF